MQQLKDNLTSGEQALLRIARESLRMRSVFARLTGMSHERARQTISQISKIKTLKSSASSGKTRAGLRHEQD
jgi:hypothetical protein